MDITDVDRQIVEYSSAELTHMITSAPDDLARGWDDLNDAQRFSRRAANELARRRRALARDAAREARDQAAAAVRQTFDAQKRQVADVRAAKLKSGDYSL